MVLPPRRHSCCYFLIVFNFLLSVSTVSSLSMWRYLLLAHTKPTRNPRRTDYSTLPPPTSYRRLKHTKHSRTHRAQKTQLGLILINCLINICKAAVLASTVPGPVLHQYHRFQLGTTRSQFSSQFVAQLRDLLTKTLCKNNVHTHTNKLVLSLDGEEEKKTRKKRKTMVTLATSFKWNTGAREIS